MNFTYTEKYPDTAPLVEIDDKVEFEGDYEGKLLQHIQETVGKSVTAHVYTSIDNKISC